MLCPLKLVSERWMVYLRVSRVALSLILHSVGHWSNNYQLPSKSLIMQHNGDGTHYLSNMQEANGITGTSVVINPFIMVLAGSVDMSL